MDDRTDDGTKLHFIPTSFSISWWAESCSVRLSRGRDGLQPATSELPGCRFAWTTGRMDRGMTGRMDRGATGRMDDGTDSGEASFHPDVRSHCPSGFRGSFICSASGEASFVRFQGKLHLFGFRGSFICPVSGETSFVRLQGKLHLSGFRGSFIVALLYVIW